MELLNEVRGPRGGFVSRKFFSCSNCGACAHAVRVAATSTVLAQNEGTRELKLSKHTVRTWSCSACGLDGARDADLPRPASKERVASASTQAKMDSAYRTFARKIKSRSHSYADARRVCDATLAALAPQIAQMEEEVEEEMDEDEMARFKATVDAAVVARAELAKADAAKQQRTTAEPAAKEQQTTAELAAKEQQTTAEPAAKRSRKAIV